MKIKLIIFALCLLFALLVPIAFAQILVQHSDASQVTAEVLPCATTTVEVYVDVPVQIKDPNKLTHAQEVWISALEWCESRGNPNAINPLDNDGTPSFYSWQFKPATFRLFGELYHVIEQGHTDAEIMELIKDYDLQKAILRNMVEDPSIRWEGQFPACVRILGRPPAY